MGIKPRSSDRHHRREPVPLAADIGARIRQIRAAQDFSFDAFVEVTGLGRGYVSELERGLVVPTVVALEKVARALDVTMADLVLGDSLREQLFDATRGMTDADVAEVVAMVEARAPKRW